MADNKHTIYIDIDDEITAIIDKVKNSPEKIVALVLPKRATVLQSIVNMKLLKRSAQKAKKSLVLITNEQGLMPLAGVVGIHVAKTLQSRPSIPLPPERDTESDEPDVSVVEDSDEPPIDKTKSVGMLIGASEAAAEIDEEEDAETIELDEEDEPEDVEITDKPNTKAKKSKFKVPNFDRFRLSLFLGIFGVIILGVGWVFASVVLPKAEITISTDTSTTVSNINFTVNTSFKDLNVDKLEVPAIKKEVKKTDTEKTTASGKKDTGTKASGTITIRNCDYSDGFTVPAGSVFSASGKRFVSSAAVSIPKFTGPSSSCTLSGNASGKNTVEVTAEAAGDSYNLSSASYNVPGVTESAKVDAIGTAMTGGTSTIVKVVSQEDVDRAAATMKGRQDNNSKKELAAQLQTESLKSLDETITVGAPVITSSPAVGAEANGDVTVTAVTTYTVLGVTSDYLAQLVKKDVSTKIDLTKQSILDDGINTAVIRVTSAKSPTESQLSLQTLVVAGPVLSEDSIKEEIKGKKRGDVEKIILGKTGVKDVNITYKPFWVFSTPKSVEKIRVTIEKPVITNDSATNPTNP